MLKRDSGLVNLALYASTYQEYLKTATDTYDRNIAFTNTLSKPKKTNNFDKSKALFDITKHDFGLNKV